MVKRKFTGMNVIALLAATLLFLSPLGEGTATGSANVGSDNPNAQKIDLSVGKSFVLDTPIRVKRVSVVDPEVADALVLSAKQIYVTGKSAGVTSLTIWVDSKVYAVYDITVSPDISRLKERLYQILPDEKDIRVSATHDGLALSGSVSSAASLSQVLGLAEAYAPENVVNLLEVRGVHQVMLEVRVAEMSRDMTKRMGFNYNYISSGGNALGMSLLSNLQLPPENIFPNDALPLFTQEDFPSELSEPVNKIFRFMSNDTMWTAFIDALKERGLVKVLAEPTLIALSGQEANFLAGGEFPIPVPQELGRTTIEYKEFGVGLHFTPTVLSDGKINIKVAPEVSELDFTNAIVFGGFVVPGITTRRVSTMIELGDGQSFAIAGLLKDNVREIVSKFPLLGDIPVLGALFRSSSYQKNETELIVIVTPHLVKPLDMAKQTLPTDQFIEPNDLEFYLLGATEGKARAAVPQASDAPVTAPGEGGLEGEFGHITPE